MTKTTLPIPPAAIHKLQSQSCFAANWQDISINPDADLELIRNVEFEGKVSIGLLRRNKEHPKCGIFNTILTDTVIGDYPSIRNVGGGISNAVIDDNVVIENTSRITYDPHPLCGIGTRISALDESGSREVVIYPGLSAQSAMLMARARREEAEEIYAQTLELIDALPLRPYIGPGAKILDSGTLHNVGIDHDVTIRGARSLYNGSIINNCPSPSSIAYVGAGVDASDFIIEDGRVESGALLRNCYVGQGAVIEKGFTAHDSLFFANCSMENGEACALFAGPYSVSMHKGTLLIGCQTSFMNAGSSTNQSNHMYKLGPVHWGVLERGVKTSSGSYLMLGANIGAFSLLMGQHKTHPDSREFPFSYLFGDAQGATVVVPAIMLRSCGLMRDQKKWPARDRRVSIPHPHDRIIFDILNPVTVSAMLNALTTIRPMLTRPADDDRYIRYKGMKLSRASLERALKLYYIGVMKYLCGVFFPEADTSCPAAEAESERKYSGWNFPELPSADEELEAASTPWIDLAGQIMTRADLHEALQAQSVKERESIFDCALNDYPAAQRRWIAAVFPPEMRPGAHEILRGAAEFDRLVALDRESYRSSLSAELNMLQL